MATSNTQTERAGHQLLGELTTVARQVQNRLRWQAVLYWLLAILAVIAPILVIDCLLQREEAGLRWLSWTILLFASIYAGYRWLLPIVNTQVRPMDIAVWMEKQQPELSGRLSTALELAEIELTDDRFGSPTFRNAALAQWDADPVKPRWNDLISNRNLKKTLAILAAILSSLVVLLAFAPDLGIHALRRLFVPWSNESWPRADQLEFVNIPSAVGPDSAIQLEVRDRRPPLPSDVSIELRYANSTESVIAILTQQVSGLAVASLPPIVEEIQVRAIGGDDQQMPWQTIRVVEVPGWKQFKFEIQPPTYIRESPAALLRLTTSPLNGDDTYEIAGQRIAVLAGSHLRFTGELTLPVRNISMQPLLTEITNARRSDPSAIQPPTPLPWMVKLKEDGKSVSSLAAKDPTKQDHTDEERYAAMEKSAAWTFRMETDDRVSLDSPQHWKIEVLQDNAPEVVIETPQLRTLSIGATLFLRGHARDDWGLRSLVAKLTISDAPEVVYELPIDIEPSKPTAQTIRQEWDYASQLASLGVTVQPQDQVSVWFEAVDLSGKTGKSNVERVTLESKQRQLESIAGRQNLLSEQLAELLAAQESAQELARRTAVDLQQQTPSQQHLDAINSVKQLQQTIHQQLVDSPESLRSEIERLQQLVIENQISDTPFAQQLQQFKDKISEIGGDSAASALQTANLLHKELAQAVSSRDKSKLPKLESELGLHQSKALSQLQELLSNLEDGNSKNRFREELIEIAQKHEQLTVDTDQLNVESLSTSKPGFAARLAVSTEKQMELTSRMELWLSAVLQLDGNQIDSNHERLTEQLLGAAQVLSDAQTVSLMRSASSDLRAEQLGLVTQSQKRVQQSLNEALSKLAQSSSSELLDSLTTQEQRLRMLRDLAGQLAEQQMQLSQELSAPQANSNAEQLAERQNKIGRDTSRIIDELDGADSISEKIRQAQQLQQLAAQATTNQSMRQAAELAAQAAKKLDEVAAALDQKANQASQQVMQQQMYELANALSQLIVDQQAIMPSYEQLGPIATELTSEFVSQSRSLIQKQSAIRESLRKLSASTEQLPVFHWVLLQAEADLTRAVASAERNRFKPDAMNAADAGLRKIVLASRSLESNNEGNDQSNSNSEDPSESQVNSFEEKSAISMPPLASLNLIRALQLEIRDQTLGLENSVDRQAQLLELTRQQKDLGSLLEQMVTEAQTQHETER